jgi:formamidopyrimidine-DNA glycosylase
VPERPDLDYVLPILSGELAGRTITGLSVKKPVVLRVAVEGHPERLLAGQTITAVTRRAHFACFALEPGKDGVALELVIAPMLAGRFLLAAAKDRAPADLALALALDDGRELRYRDDVQMGKVYVVPAGQAAALIPGYAKIGVDVLDARAFTRVAFRKLARARRDQAKVFLMDKAALDAFGNAYADEALWAARVHPKAAVRTLSDAELDRLHDAMVETLAFAGEEIRRRKPPLDEKLRDFLKVRNRHGEVCPRCGDKIRKAGVHGHDAFFCPTCQVLPGAGGLGTKSVVDWRKTRDK